MRSLCNKKYIFFPISIVMINTIHYICTEPWLERYTVSTQIYTLYSKQYCSAWEIYQVSKTDWLNNQCKSIWMVPAWYHNLLSQLTACKKNVQVGHTIVHQNGPRLQANTDTFRKMKVPSCAFMVSSNSVWIGVYQIRVSAEQPNAANITNRYIFGLLPGLYVHHIYRVTQITEIFTVIYYVIWYHSKRPNWAKFVWEMIFA
jgi:hypothetical protein